MKRVSIRIHGPARLACVLVSACCLLVFASLGLTQSDIMRIEAPSVPAPQRPGVTFPHGTHSAAFDCQQCHHTYENGTNTWTPGDPTECAGCHDPADTGKRGLRRASHELCLGCHRKAAMENKNAPLMCGGCHREGGRK